MTLRILTVCTGNVCRSPLAAQLLTARLEPTWFEVHSAGVAALVGDPMPDIARNIAAGLGSTTANDHQAVSLTKQDVIDADLVLGVTRQHRRAVAQLYPKAARLSFTLTEFAHIGSAIDDERLAHAVRDSPDTAQAVVDTVSMMRGTVESFARADQYDVVDPYRQRAAVYRRSAAQVDTAVDRIVELFRRAHRFSGAEATSNREA